MIEIRLATTTDVPTVVACHLACWHEAYRDLVPATYLAELEQSVPARIDHWTTMITSGAEVWIATDDDTVIGLASAGPSTDEDVTSDRELFALYVRAAHWKTGLGHRLLDAAVAAHPASLWVLRSNTRAIDFYRSHGFIEDGTTKLHPRLALEVIRLTR